MNEKRKLLVMLIIPLFITAAWSYMLGLYSQNYDHELNEFVSSIWYLFFVIIWVSVGYISVVYQWIKKIGDKEILKIVVPIAVFNIIYIIYRYIYQLIRIYRYIIYNIIFIKTKTLI